MSGRLRAAAARAPVVPVALGVALQAGGSVLVAFAHLGGLGLSFWRFWVSIPILALMARKARSTPTVDGASRRWVGWTVVAGVAFAVHQVSFLVAIKRTSVVDVALVQVLQPVLVGLAAVPIFGERMSARFRLWSCVGMIGAACVILDGAGGPEGDPLGMALAVVSVSFFVVYFLISKEVRPFVEVSRFLLVVTVVATTCVTLLVVATRTDVWAVTTRDLLIAVAIALIGGVAGHYLITWPLQFLPVSLPPVIQLLFPFVAGSLAWAVLGESITVVHLLGGALTIVGVLGAVRARRPVAERLAT